MDLKEEAMPITQKRLFKCEKCGYSKTYTVGDYLTPNDLMKKWPKCSSMMVVSSDENAKNTSGFLDSILDLFKK